MSHNPSQRDIVVVLCGGLGNQMFQYAAGRALALRHGASLMLDVSSFAHDPKREYALTPFFIDAGVTRLSSFLLWRKKIRGKIYRERGFFYDPAVEELSVGVIMRGYFPSEKYFAAAAEQIRTDFTLREPLSMGAKTYLREIENSFDAVSVHVRRGDYVSDPVTTAFHGNCTWEYYEEAMSFISEKSDVTRFFFFSDEPEWLLARKVAGAVVRGLSSHEDMLLMSRCKHHIIANSSFSWWGAWLNRNPGKIVVAPRRWFADENVERQTGDMIPKDWVRL